MKRNLVLIVVIAVTNIPISCIEDDCGGFTPLEARISELTPFVGSYSSSGFSTANTTEYERAAINITINNMEYSEISHVFKRPFSLTNSAYACSPPDPEPTQTINSIIITSESTVYSGGQEYKSGDNLIDIFKVTGFSYSDEETTVDQFIERQIDDLWILDTQGLMQFFNF